MSDQLGPPIDYFAHYQGGDLHILLDRAGAVEADGAGLKENPPRLMTAAERIKRLGEDNVEHIRQARYWRGVAERLGAK